MSVCYSLFLKIVYFISVSLLHYRYSQMLKWAVGQRPSTASSTCSEITSGVACCPSTFSKNTVTLQPSTNRSTTIRTAYVRNLKTANKENRRKCKRSLVCMRFKVTSINIFLSGSVTATEVQIHY